MIPVDQIIHTTFNYMLFLKLLSGLHIDHYTDTKSSNQSSKFKRNKALKKTCQIQTWRLAHGFAINFVFFD